jgi:uncharacterized protein YdeI (YjbR/CyaY-like superfamily)
MGSTLRKKAVEPIFFSSPLKLRAWLHSHHLTAGELWVGLYRRATGRPSVTWPQIVDEVLCVGWIDGVRQPLDDQRWSIRVTPRRRGSRWSAVNIRRWKALLAARRVLPAGKTAFEGRRAETDYAYEQRRQVKFGAAETGALRRNARAWAWFSSRAPSYQRNATFWVMSAKQEETRKRRLARLIADSAAGRPVPPLSYVRK